MDAITGAAEIMGYWIDENTYQCDDKKELAAVLGIDLETIEGDYGEAYQHMNQFWKEANIDVIFDEKQDST